MNNAIWLVILLALTAPVSAQTEAQKQIYVMTVDPPDPGSEYAIMTAEKIVILIPPTVAMTVGDNASERELVAAFIRLNFIFTGRMRVLIPPRWFEFEDVNTKKRYRFFENDKTTVTALFVDGSTVQFAFIGTAIQCPSGQCFAWVVGTETRPLIHPPRRGAGGIGKGREGHFVASDQLRLLGRPYNPYDPANWSGPGRAW